MKLHSLRGSTDWVPVEPKEAEASALAPLIAEPDLSGLEEHTLPNGLKVWLLPYGDLPIARTHLVFRGGSMWEQKPLQADFATDHLRTLRGDLLDINEVRNHYGLMSSTRYYSQYGVWSFEGTYAPLQIQLLGVRVQQAHITDPNVKKWLKGIETNLASWRETASYHARGLRFRHLVPDQPRRFADPQQRESAAEQLKRADAAAFLDQIIRPDGTTLIVVGRFDRDAVLEQARADLGRWPVPGAERRQTTREPSPPPTQRAVYVLEDDLPRPMARVELACRVPQEVGSFDWYFLDGLINGLLTRKLREEAAATYDVNVRAVGTDNGNELWISTTVPHAASGLAVSVLVDALRLAADGFDDATLAAAKRATALRSSRWYRTTASLVSWLQRSAAYQRDPTSLGNWAEKIASVDGQVLSQHLANCTGAEVVTVVGHVDVLTEQLDKANVPHEVVDWRGAE